jgi:hypothetical protein
MLCEQRTPYYEYSEGLSVPAWHFDACVLASAPDLILVCRFMMKLYHPLCAKRRQNCSAEHQDANWIKTGNKHCHMKDGAPVLWIVFSIWNSDGEVYVDLVRRRMPHQTSVLLRAQVLQKT